MECRPHDDPGLQPERTVMAWARTMMSLFVVSAIFLRWLPRHGWPVAILVAVAGATALAIYISQRRRYHHQATGIRTSRLRADVTATLLTSTAVVGLGALGMLVGG